VTRLRSRLRFASTRQASLRQEAPAFAPAFAKKLRPGKGKLRRGKSARQAEAMAGRPAFAGRLRRDEKFNNCRSLLN